MNYDKDQFIWEVTNEAVMLRKHATKEEREKLSVALLAPMNPERCIYGLTTGHCFSKRAAQLIATCCPRYFHKGAVKHYNNFQQVATNVNGTKVSSLFKKRTQGTVNYYSAIEAYITLPSARNGNLISYLRGETDDLDLYF